MWMSLSRSQTCISNQLHEGLKQTNKQTKNGRGACVVQPVKHLPWLRCPHHVYFLILKVHCSSNPGLAHQYFLYLDKAELKVLYSRK